jgi:hypothetical protein
MQKNNYSKVYNIVIIINELQIVVKILSINSFKRYDIN